MTNPIGPKQALDETYWEEVAGGPPAPVAPNPSSPPAQAAPQAVQGSPQAAQAAPQGDLGESFFEEVAATSQGATPSDTSSAPPLMFDDFGTGQPRTDAQVQGQGAMMAAVPLGAAKGVFATRDFFATGAGLWDDPPAEAERSAPRQWVDAQSARLAAETGTPYSLTEGLAQGAVGLLGASKLAWGGAAVKAVAGAIGTAASLEPHAGNFMNLAQSIPGVDGPLTRFLASDPGDSTTVGYVKNALVSLGLEGAAVGLFMGTAAVLKAFSGGNRAAIEAASADLEATLAAHREEQGATWTSATPLPSSPSSSASELPAPVGESSPSSIGSAQRVDPEALQPPPSSTPPNADAAEVARPSERGPTISAGASTGVPADEAISEPANTAGRPALGGAPGSALQAPAATSTAPEPFSIATANVDRIVSGWEADQQALIKYGSWEAAVANGHTFGGEDRIPWQVLARSGADGQPSTSMDAFIARVSAGYAKLADDLKGGAVATDGANLAAVERRVQLWNEDPNALLGALQTAGERAGSLRADMMASFAIAQRAMQDSWTLASRINIGDFSEFGGSRAAAVEALKQQTGIAATLLASAQSIRANSARAMRGLRSEFRLDPVMVRNLAALDGEHLVSLLSATKGDPLALKTALQPGLLTRIVEGTQLYLVNNLIWNPLTHAVIFGSNSWQALARPAMRAVGSLDNGSFGTVGKEALKSYHFMLSSFPDAFRSAMQAFRTGDSIIAPHDFTAAESGVSGGAQGSTGLGQKIAQAEFAPMDSPANFMRNALLLTQKTFTLPSRGVTFQDELVKQVVYRGKVQAKAMVEGAAQGLKGADLEQYVKGKLYDSFDDFGRATDGEALQEAKTATYQNDLNPTAHLADLEYNTLGYSLQRGLERNPVGRILIPFVRTPVNLYRQGVQLTPGLNLIQAEYRDAISGVPREGEPLYLAKQRQAQATGQMAMGMLIAGTGASLAYMGFVTGEGPIDPKLRRDAEQDGWRPNSIVIPHADGSRTYVPFNRFDPVMMPFAIAANIVNVLKSDEPADQHKAESMAAALGLALYRAVTEKLYLENVSRTIETLMDPEKHLGSYAGGMLSNYLPAASALRIANPDPSMREAYDFQGALLGKVPFFSENIPPRRDWAGDPIGVHKGLWLSTPADKANAEIERLALSQGDPIGAPGSKGRGEADYRTIQLAGNADPDAKGANAYDRFQELSGHPERIPGANPNTPSLRKQIADLIATPAYQNAPDGSAGTEGTKAAMAMKLISASRQAARKFMAADNNVRAAEYAETMRVAKHYGYATPDMPTQANETDGFLKSIGKFFGH